ncbi:MAG: TIGR01777 family oxidoreductase [Bacteriovoracaceae bacterium]
MKFLLTGGTGFVGKPLVNKLLEAGHSVVLLSSRPQMAKNMFQDKIEAYYWKSTETLPPVDAFKDVDAVINLAGENISNKRWTSDQKQKIYESRILTTRHLMQCLETLPQKIKVVVSTSAIGIYGDRPGEFLAESSTVGGGFLANVCEHWEREVLKKSSAVDRTVILRVGVVLGKGGGMIEKLLPPFKLGAGGPIGNGKQFMSWIHLNDLVDLYIFAATSSMNGIYNAVSTPVTNARFTEAFGKALHRPAFFTVPPIALKIMMGGMSALALDNQKIVSERLRIDGYEFKFPKIENALEDIVKK